MSRERLVGVGAAVCCLLFGSRWFFVSVSFRMRRPSCSPERKGMRRCPNVCVFCTTLENRRPNPPRLGARWYKVRRVTTIFTGSSSGGGFSNVGTVFKLTKDGLLSILHNFDGKHLGGQPRGGLTLGSDGYLYGTTIGGGDGAAGTIFKISRSGSEEPVLLHTFAPGKIVPPLPYPQQPTKQQTMDAAPGYPSSPPVEGSDGYLYGVTSAAANGAGALYQISPGGDYKCLYVFNGKDDPRMGSGLSTLARGADDNIYGVTWHGGIGTGTVFRFDPAQKSSANGGITTIYKFVNIYGKEADGELASNVIVGHDHNLYGTAYAGGPGARGVVFRLTPGGEYTILHYFGGNQANPTAGVVEVPQIVDLAPGSGTPPPQEYYLYGVCNMCGAGTAFRVKEDGEDFADVYNFGGTNGVGPNATLVLARDSNLYGLTLGGGKGYGVFYRIDKAYSVTGQVEMDTVTDPAHPHQKLIFEGNVDGKTWIYTGLVPQAEIQVATHMAGYQPQLNNLSRAKAADGITVRVTDKTVKIVQFYYRMLLDQKGHPVEGVVDIYQPTISYPAGADVHYVGQLWLSAVQNNLDHPPPAQACSGAKPGCTDGYWVLAAMNNGQVVAVCPQLSMDCATVPPCQGNVGPDCDTLSTNALAPNWIVDAQYHRPDPFYVAIDTQIDCDGFTLFDSPTLFSWVTNEDQIFGAMDFVILHGAVIATVRWTYEKKFAAAPEYTVNISGPPNGAVLAAMQKLTLAQGFNVPFGPGKP